MQQADEEQQQEGAARAEAGRWGEALRALLAGRDDGGWDGGTDSAGELLYGVAEGVAVCADCFGQCAEAVRQDVADGEALSHGEEDVDGSEPERADFRDGKLEEEEAQQQQRTAGKQGLPGAEAVVDAAADGCEHGADDAARKQDAAGCEGCLALHNLGEVRQEKADAEADELEAEQSHRREREGPVAQDGDVEQWMRAALEQALLLTDEKQQRKDGQEQQEGEQQRL